MKIRIHSLQQKILFSLLLVIAAFTLIGAFGYWASLKNGYGLTIEAVDTSLSHISREADVLLGEIQSRAAEVAGDPELQQALRVDLPDTKQEIYKQRLHFNNRLYYEKLPISRMDGLYVIGENGAMFHATYSFRADDYREAWWYRQAIDNNETVWITPQKGSEVGNNLDFLTLSIVIPIQDRASTRILGAVIAEVQMRELEQMLFEDLAFDGTICMIDDHNEVIYFHSPDGKEKTESVSEEETVCLFMDEVSENLQKNDSEKEAGYSFFQIGGERQIAVFSGLSDSPWKLLCLVSTDKVLADLHRLWMVIIISGIVLVLAAIIFSIYTSDGIVKPVRAMQSVMKEAEKGDFSVQVENPEDDEIGDLGRGLNHMIRRIDELMKQERETQEKLKRADLNALQSQINPHFLYNTLDSINWMARMGRTDKVEEMIDSLTSFLRIGLSRGRTFITLEDELKHVESYFSIQKVRYHSLLNYQIQVPESLYRYKVIKMTLQPLVENSLYHGIKEKDEPGTITVQAYEVEKFLIIKVSDDGLGMTQERLEEVQQMMRTGTAQNNDAYGIINVQRRIRSYFGEEYGLTFESIFEEGTTVTVRLPKEPMENENV